MTDYLEKFAAQRDIGERISVFAESLLAEQSPELRILEKKALEEGVPIIRPHTRGLIQCLLEMLAPRRILEIGTAVGYSALVMYTYAPETPEIITIERDEKRDDPQGQYKQTDDNVSALFHYLASLNPFY